MQSLRDGLLKGGAAADRIHWESFGTAEPNTTKACDLSRGSRNVRFVKSQTDAEWHDPEQTVWELAREHEVELPSGCLSGVCGSCRVKLISGEVEYDRDISLELAGGECLTCVAKPKTDLVIDA